MSMYVSWVVGNGGGKYRRVIYLSWNDMGLFWVELRSRNQTIFLFEKCFYLENTKENKRRKMLTFNCILC